jgi:hypothetical protein
MKIVDFSIKPLQSNGMLKPGMPVDASPRKDTQESWLASERRDKRPHRTITHAIAPRFVSHNLGLGRRLSMGLGLGGIG